MNKKDIFKTLIAQKQSEMPFSVIDRDVSRCNSFDYYDII